MKRAILVPSVMLTLATLVVVPTGTASAHDDCAGECRGFLGVQALELTPELQQHYGVDSHAGTLVSAVLDDSPAAAAGLEVGDVLTAIDGTPIDSPGDLRRTVRRRAGEVALLEVYRDGRRLELEATLGEKPTYDFHWDGDVDLDDLDLDFDELTDLGWQYGALGMEIGAEVMSAVAEAMAEVDWDEIGATVEESIDGSMEAMENWEWHWDEHDFEQRLEERLRVLEEQDWHWEWDEEEFERKLEERLKALEQRLQELDRWAEERDGASAAD